jgi:spore maturation protein CgeB
MKLRIAMFYHSLVSDWNHGNAHFLRGVASELIARGHHVRVFEPSDAWSRINLLRDHGEEAITLFKQAFPHLASIRFSPGNLELDAVLDGSDVVIAHEWNDPALVGALGAYRRRNPRVRLFFHDTHHRAITAGNELASFDLDGYDAVLAYGASLKEVYERRGWGRQVFVWHEAADTRTFYPRLCTGRRRDVVWIGNWGDEERTEELRSFFVLPIRRRGWDAGAYGVRYPQAGIVELNEAGIEYGGWLPNFRVPEVFAQFRAAVHIPRRPYTQHLPGIPTIRPFEALACGIPLVSAPWQDSEGLFRKGQDFLMARSGAEMESLLADVLRDESLAAALARNGLETIRKRHTCAHRVDEFLAIYDALKPVSKDTAAIAARAKA